MRNKITIFLIAILIANNLIAQTITWENADIFTQTASGLVYLSATNTTVYAIKNNSDIYSVVEGNVTFLHGSNLAMNNCVGGIGVGCNPYYSIKRTSDLSVIHQNTSGISTPVSVKGDTTLFLMSIRCYT
jgi:hypothetical protein